MTEGLTVAGSGPPIVFCHGMLLDRTMFEPQMRQLAGRFTVVAYDQRAADQRGEQPYDLSALAEDCRRVIALRGLNRPVLGGMSMGGLVALRVALDDPELLSGLVLIASTPAPEHPDVRGQLRSVLSACSDAASLPAELVRQEAEAHFAMRTQRERPELVSRLGQSMSSRSGRAAWRELCAWIDEADLTPGLAELDLPVLIVHGDEDRLVPLDRGLDAFRAARRGRLCVVPYAGHAVNLEAAERVSEAIAAFAQECLTEQATQV